MLPIAIIIAAALVASTVVGLLVVRSSRAAERQGPVTVERIEAELLLELALRGELAGEDAIAVVRRFVDAECGRRGRIDMASWIEQYVRLAPKERREALLECAVLVAMESGTTVALPQYDALVELTFGLGFHSDALARLRQKHGFDYVDWAKHGRPRGADRGGGATPLFDAARGQDAAANLAALGLAQGAGRQDIVAAYRRLALECHPDRFHESSADERTAAAERFRSVTRAYEELLAERSMD